MSDQDLLPAFPFLKTQPHSLPQVGEYLDQPQNAVIDEDPLEFGLQATQLFALTELPRLLCSRDFLLANPVVQAMRNYVKTA